MKFDKANVDKTKFGRPTGSDEGSTDVVTAAGRDFKCRRSKAKDRSEAGDTLIETLSSDDAPGRFVKSHAVVPSINQTVDVELVEVKLPE